MNHYVLRIHTFISHFFASSFREFVFLSIDVLYWSIISTEHVQVHLFLNEVHRTRILQPNIIRHLVQKGTPLLQRLIFSRCNHILLVTNVVVNYSWMIMWRLNVYVIGMMLFIEKKVHTFIRPDKVSTAIFFANLSLTRIAIFSDSLSLHLAGVIHRHNTNSSTPQNSKSTSPHPSYPPGHEAYEALSSLVDVAVKQPSLPVPLSHATSSPNLNQQHKEEKRLILQEGVGDCFGKESISQDR